MNDIFISYKREEQPVARKLSDALQKKGWSVWWDPKLRAGEHFDDAIERALNDAKCVIVMWSKLSVNSRYVKDEATYALNRNKLVPIAIDEVDLPFRFEGIQTGRLINWDGSDSFSGFQKLVVDIASILGEPPIEMKERKRREVAAKRKAEEERRRKEAEEERKRKEAEEEQERKEAEVRRKAEEERKRKEPEDARRKAVEERKARQNDIIRLRLEVKGRKGKTVTIIFGFQLDQGNLKALARHLKQQCGTGGSVKDDMIIIQGDHREKLTKLLMDQGYDVKLAYE